MIKRKKGKRKGEDFDSLWEESRKMVKRGVGYFFSLEAGHFGFFLRKERKKVGWPWFQRGRRELWSAMVEKEKSIKVELFCAEKKVPREKE